MDRIPFVLLFGIATSLDLFHERLSKSASRFLDGVQFDVEQTSSVLQRIFQKAVIASEAPLRLGSTLVSSLIERQHDHVQSVQSFIVALKVRFHLPSLQHPVLTVKYAYMCHFYGNPLSWLSDVSAYESLSKLIQPHHLEVVKTLPSFQRMVEGLVENKQLARAEVLLRDDKALLKEIMNSLESKNISIIQLLQAMSILSSFSSESLNKIDLYMTAFQGGLAGSDYVKRAIDSLKRMAPDNLVKFIEGISNCIENGNSEVNLAGLGDEDDVLLTELREIHPQVAALAIESVKAGKPIRNSSVIHSKGLRTTVIAQRVQLSFENSTLTEQDIEFTALVDHLTACLEKYFSKVKNPQEIFLNEAWLYDWTIPQKSVFSPRPREAIELALSTPYQYLSCECCESAEGLSSTHPAASIVFQMYLETGSFINIFDLWSAFLEMVGGTEEQKCDERDALVMFYRGLADLKSLGVVKQSKKKADHLAKIAWKGL